MRQGHFKKRIRLCWGTFLFVVTSLACERLNAARPNILLILADDVGREVLGCYGGTSYQTPNIDQLAASGIRFLHAYAMPMCHPTRVCLMTGQYPFRLGNPAWGTFPKSAEHRSLGQVLKRAGYATAIAGKWQLTLLRDDLDQPTRMGFDEYCLDGWHEGPWYYQPHIWHNGALRRDVQDRYGPDVICDFVIDFVRRHKDGPFFAFYSMELCHAETNDLDEPAPKGPHGRYDSYSEMVVKMDERVGRVIAVLQELNLRENTLVLYFSDNGTAAKNLINAVGDKYIYEDIVSEMGDRKIPGGKGTLTDWGTRVPLIASWPGKVSPGQITDALFDASDFLPSLADIADAPLPHDANLDGRSMVAQLCGRDTSRPWVYAQHQGRSYVRSHRWKLYSDGRLFNMSYDTDEKNPLTTATLPAQASHARDDLKKAMDELASRNP